MLSMNAGFAGRESESEGGTGRVGGDGRVVAGGWGAEGGGGELDCSV